MKFLVTGGSGFIGTNLIRILLAQGHEVVNLDKRSPHEEYATADHRHPCSFFQRELGDCDSEELADILCHEQIETVIHLAAETHVDRSIASPDEFFSSNVEGTFDLLKAAKQYYELLEGDAQNRFRFLNVSTDEVFGSLALGEPCFDENSNYRPNSPYSASKAAGDHFVRAFFQTYGLPTIISHCSNNFGPFQFPEKLIPVVIKKCLAEEAIPVYGDGTNFRDWIFVDDHCEGLLSLAEKGKPGESYVVGANQERSNIELVSQICETMNVLAPRAHGKCHKQLITFVSDRPGHDFRYAIDSTKMRRETGWAPSRSLDDALTSTVNWYVEHREWLSLDFF